MKFARIENNIAVLISRDPAREADPDWSQVPDHAFAGHRLVDGEWVAPEPDLTAQPDQVIAERDRRINEGTTINVPGIGDIPVSGSPVVQADLTSLAQAAQIAMAAGNSEAMFPFRDRANTTHALTPEQVVSLFMSGVDWLASVRAAAWALIDADPIPADFADDRHWPAP